MLTSPADPVGTIDSRGLPNVLAKVQDGDFTARLPLEGPGAAGEVTEVSLADVRHALLGEFESVAESKGLDYSIDLAPDTPCAIVTDRRRLHQVLESLIANAFRFTTRGEVHVEIGIVDDEWSYETSSLVKTPSVIGFSVRDTGVGLVPEEHQTIFEALAQVDDPTAGDHGTLGPGLSISRSIVGLLGGEITVTSTQGEGSTFSVYLPLVLSPTSAPGVIAPGETAGADLHETFAVAQDLATNSTRLREERPLLHALDDYPFAGRKVLVVDDDPRNVFAMTALLERRHAEVISAAGGLEAITLLERTHDVDLVLMDIMMPGMDGYETMRAIRTREEFMRLPIIAVTGKEVVGERERCTDAGANDFLPKPVDTRNLLAAIGPWLVSGR